jgi:A118 family predicted phage portal protein
MGQSVFEDAVDAVKAVDDAFDTIVRELAVTKPKVFMADQLLQDFTDEGGNRVVAPMAPEETVIRAVSGFSGEDLIKTFQPDIRATELRTMLDTALAELGDLTGLGQSYLTLDHEAGLKTATEVSADNSALMRNLRKHEVSVGASLSRMLTAACSCARSLCGVETGEPGIVRVTWDDSIIEDTPAEKAQFLSEVSAGLRSPWEYRVRFCGEDEQTARERAEEAATRGGSPATSGLGL